MTTEDKQYQTLEELKEDRSKLMSRYNDLQDVSEMKRMFDGLLGMWFKAEKALLESKSADGKSGPVDKANWLTCSSCNAPFSVSPRYEANPICKDCREIQKEASNQVREHVKPLIHREFVRQQLQTPIMRRMAREASLLKEGKTSTEIQQIISQEFDVTDRTVREDMRKARE